MKYQNHTSGAYSEEQDRIANGRGSDIAGAGGPGLDMTLQSHLGRTLRRVYEPEVGGSLPQDLMNLLEQLDSIPAYSRGDVSRHS